MDKQHNPKTLEQRLYALERDNHSLRRLCHFLVLLTCLPFVATWLMGAKSGNQAVHELTVQHFKVVDSNGTVRMEVRSYDRQGIFQRFYNQDGVERIQLHITENDVARLALLYEEGLGKSLEMVTYPSDFSLLKTAPIAGYVVFDRNEAIRVWNGTTKNGGLYQTLSDREGRIRISNFIDQEGNIAQGFYGQNRNVQAATSISKQSQVEFAVARGKVEATSSIQDWVKKPVNLANQFRLLRRGKP